MHGRSRMTVDPREGGDVSHEVMNTQRNEE